MERYFLKIREIIHFIFHINIYWNKAVILRGVPKILYGSRIIFGDNVRLNENVYIHAANGINIGENTTLSYGAMLISESYDVKNWNCYLERHHAGAPIVIGKNCWICAGTIVLPGITIADNIIVGAGSVVTRDLLEEKCLYAGNPARLIKRLD